MHGGNDLKFCTLMYLDHLQNWLVYGYGLVIFLILALFGLSETGQIWGFRVFPREHMEEMAWNLARWCILTIFRTDKFMVTVWWFLAATKQLYKWYFPSVRLSVCLSVCPSVRLSVCPSHLFDYVPIIVSSWNFQELLPVTEVTSMQKVKVRGQRSRSQRSQPNFTVSGL